MNLMLGVIFGCIAFGLLVPRFGGREMLITAGVAALMTAIYLFVGRAM